MRQRIQKNAHIVNTCIESSIVLILNHDLMWTLQPANTNHGLPGSQRHNLVVLEVDHLGRVLHNGCGIRAKEVFALPIKESMTMVAT